MYGSEPSYSNDVDFLVPGIDLNNDFIQFLKQIRLRDDDNMPFSQGVIVPSKFLDNSTDEMFLIT